MEMGDVIRSGNQWFVITFVDYQKCIAGFKVFSSQKEALDFRFSASKKMTWIEK